MLLLIDPQNDFIRGSLMVEGAKDAMNNLSTFIRNESDEYELIVCTIDWHPTNHSSFKEFGGEWNRHCVICSDGACIDDDVLTSIKDKAINKFHILTKGTDHNVEEYSVMKNQSSNDHLKFLVGEYEIEEIDCCGIALDYCVKNTIIDLRKELPNIKVNLIKDFSPSIGEASDTLAELETNYNVNII